jgi:hypothetical protein
MEDNHGRKNTRAVCSRATCPVVLLLLFNLIVPQAFAPMSLIMQQKMRALSTGTKRFQYIHVYIKLLVPVLLLLLPVIYIYKVRVYKQR